MECHAFFDFINDIGIDIHLYFRKHWLKIASVPPSPCSFLLLPIYIYIYIVQISPNLQEVLNMLEIMGPWRRVGENGTTETC